MIQGGAGTSTNMNANEVIANRALEILGHEIGLITALVPSIGYDLAGKLDPILLPENMIKPVKPHVDQDNYCISRFQL